MRQTARLAMMRDGVIGLVADKIRLVVADDQLRLPPQMIEHQAGEAPVAVVEHGGVHLAPHAVIDIGHAVLGHQDGRPARRQPLIEQRAHGVMIGIEDLAAARRHLSALKPTLPGIAIDSLERGIEVATFGSRLQSITSRE